MSAVPASSPAKSLGGQSVHSASLGLGFGLAAWGYQSKIRPEEFAGGRADVAKCLAQLRRAFIGRAVDESKLSRVGIQRIGRVVKQVQLCERNVAQSRAELKKVAARSEDHLPNWSQQYDKAEKKLTAAEGQLAQAKGERQKQALLALWADRVVQKQAAFDRAKARHDAANRPLPHLKRALRVAQRRLDQARELLGWGKVYFSPQPVLPVAPLRLESLRQVANQDLRAALPPSAQHIPRLEKNPTVAHFTIPAQGDVEDAGEGEPPSLDERIKHLRAYWAMAQDAIYVAQEQVVQAAQKSKRQPTRDTLHRDAMARFDIKQLTHQTLIVVNEVKAARKSQNLQFTEDHQAFIEAIERRCAQASLVWALPSLSAVFSASTEEGYAEPTQRLLGNLAELDRRMQAAMKADAGKKYHLGLLIRVLLQEGRIRAYAGQRAHRDKAVEGLVALTGQLLDGLDASRGRDGAVLLGLAGVSDDLDPALKCLHAKAMEDFALYQEPGEATAKKVLRKRRQHATDQAHREFEAASMKRRLQRAIEQGGGPPMLTGAAGLRMDAALVRALRNTPGFSGKDRNLLLAGWLAMDQLVTASSEANTMRELLQARLGRQKHRLGALRTDWKGVLEKLKKIDDRLKQNRLVQQAKDVDLQGGRVQNDPVRQNLEHQRSELLKSDTYCSYQACAEDIRYLGQRLRALAPDVDRPKNLAMEDSLAPAGSAARRNARLSGTGPASSTALLLDDAVAAPIGSGGSLSDDQRRRGQLRELEVARATAAYLTAQVAEKKFAVAEVQRSWEMGVGGGKQAAVDLKKAEAALQVAQTQLQAAQTQLRQIEADLAAASPGLDGTPINRLGWTGQDPQGRTHRMSASSRRWLKRMQTQQRKQQRREELGPMGLTLAELRRLGLSGDTALEVRHTVRELTRAGFVGVAEVDALVAGVNDVIGRLHAHRGMTTAALANQLPTLQGVNNETKAAQLADTLLGQLADDAALRVVGLQSADAFQTAWTALIRPGRIQQALNKQAEGWPGFAAELDMDAYDAALDVQTIGTFMQRRHDAMPAGYAQALRDTLRASVLVVLRSTKGATVENFDPAAHAPAIWQTWVDLVGVKRAALFRPEFDCILASPLGIDGLNVWQATTFISPAFAAKQQQEADRRAQALHTELHQLGRAHGRALNAHLVEPFVASLREMHRHSNFELKLGREFAVQAEVPVDPSGSIALMAGVTAISNLQVKVSCNNFIEVTVATGGEFRASLDAQFGLLQAQAARFKAKLGAGVEVRVSRLTGLQLAFEKNEKGFEQLRNFFLLLLGNQQFRAKDLAQVSYGMRMQEHASARQGRLVARAGFELGGNDSAFSVFLGGRAGVSWDKSRSKFKAQSTALTYEKDERTGQFSGRIAGGAYLKGQLPGSDKGATAADSSASTPLAEVGTERKVTWQEKTREFHGRDGLANPRTEMMRESYLPAGRGRAGMVAWVTGSVFEPLRNALRNGGKSHQQKAEQLDRVFAHVRTNEKVRARRILDPAMADLIHDYELQDKALSERRTPRRHYRFFNRVRHWLQQRAMQKAAKLLFKDPMSYLTSYVQRVVTRGQTAARTELDLLAVKTRAVTEDKGEYIADDVTFMDAAEQALVRDAREKAFQAEQQAQAQRRRGTGRRGRREQPAAVQAA